VLTFLQILTIFLTDMKLLRQLFNVYSITDTMQTEMHTAEPRVSESCCIEVKICTEEQNLHKSSGIDQITAEVTRAWGDLLCSEIQKHANSIWDKEELPQQWNDSIILHIYKMGIKLSVIIIQKYQRYQPHTQFWQYCCLKFNSISRRSYWGSSAWIST